MNAHPSVLKMPRPVMAPPNKQLSCLQVLSILEGSSKPDGHKFPQRVQGAFNNPNDMRGLRLEMMAATHFTRRGRKVSRFLSSVDRDHVVGVGFVSVAGVQPVEDGLVALLASEL